MRKGIDQQADAFFCPNEEDGLIQTIIEEMGRGNFSFLILVIGILQLIVMLRKKH